MKRMHCKEGEHVLVTLGSAQSIFWWNRDYVQSGYIEVKARSEQLSEAVIDMMERQVCEFHSEPMNSPPLKTRPLSPIDPKHLSDSYRGASRLEMPCRARQ